ncbi:NADH-quinone oxidoreductase subunit C [Lutibacter sp.]|uniref:NADH-quinone oxidoreductase subunit C n=1 Tax=Lutibacter sp. TaxID=1925666 RepID=UPI0025C0A315|nr:NADH-quinone oxidoreductase subunit C [Lutibacter sp.]MCF6180471.1 NADH-quinone oxidoreductase subunit C [Lutibacter sp.]
MKNEDLQNIINGLGENLEFSTEESEFLNVLVPKEQLHTICSQLKSNKDLKFDYAFCITGMDWGKELGVIYHLNSTEFKHEIVVKVKTEDRENPTLDSVHDIWQTAEFHELEIYDFFGIKFNNHPKLRRLFLTPDWEGFPLRKDYVDEANMIIK